MMVFLTTSRHLKGGLNLYQTGLATHYSPEMVHMRCKDAQCRGSSTPLVKAHNHAHSMMAAAGDNSNLSLVDQAQVAESSASCSTPQHSWRSQSGALQTPGKQWSKVPPTRGPPSLTNPSPSHTALLEYRSGLLAALHKPPQLSGGAKQMHADTRVWVLARKMYGTPSI